MCANDSAAVFEVTDPRGWTVVCSSECWNDHVLREHPFMVGREDDVAQAIENPTPGFIYKDRDYPERNIYYRRTYSEPYYLKVVVEFSSEKGQVVTAFLTDSSKAGEVIIWPD